MLVIFIKLHNYKNIYITVDYANFASRSGGKWRTLPPGKVNIHVKKEKGADAAPNQRSISQYILL